MKNIISIAFIPFLMQAGAFAIQQQPGQKTIAVLYFDNNSLVEREELDPLRKGLTDMFITEFSKIQAFKVVERMKLEKLLQEMALGQSGLLPESSAQKVGQLLGAQYLLFGSFINIYKNRFRLDVRIVNVESGLTIKAEEETGKLKNLSKLIARLVAKVIKNLDIRITSNEALELARAENNSLDAALLYSRGLEYEDRGDIKNAIKMFGLALKKNKNYRSAQKKIDRLKNKN